MNKTKINISIFTFLAVFTLIFTGCKDDDVATPEDENEEELITTVELTFTEGPNTSVFRFSDPDGDGGNAPTETDTVRLKAKTIYDLRIRFLDESKTPTEDITLEVKEESNEHLVCYDSTDGIETIRIKDRDFNELNLGLNSDVVTGEASNGTLSISLKHQPDIKDGSCDVGETDVEVSFVLEIK